jgi:hypothetical protein
MSTINSLITIIDSNSESLQRVAKMYHDNEFVNVKTFTSVEDFFEFQVQSHYIIDMIVLHDKQEVLKNYQVN